MWAVLNLVYGLAVQPAPFALKPLLQDFSATAQSSDKSAAEIVSPTSRQTMANRYVHPEVRTSTLIQPLCNPPPGFERQVSIHSTGILLPCVAQGVLVLPHMSVVKMLRISQTIVLKAIHEQQF